jgi:hypothetical protein
MDVSVILGTANALWVGRILKVEENETTKAVLISRARANRCTIAGLFVDDNIVRAANGELIEPSSKVRTSELNRLVTLLQFNVKNLGKIKDLYAMTFKL